jgi:hypothetical protein
MRLIQAPSISADWTGLIVDVPKECGQDEANTDTGAPILADWTGLMVDVPKECGQ